MFVRLRFGGGRVVALDLRRRDCVGDGGGDVEADNVRVRVRWLAAVADAVLGRLSPDEAADVGWRNAGRIYGVGRHVV